MTTGKRQNGNRRGEAGYVLIIVLLLIIMFTGLGVLAMRHTTQELRSSGAYLDATEAAGLVRGALSLVATDLRTSSDYYEYQFLATEADQAADAGAVETYEIPLSDQLFGTQSCGSSSSHAGCIDFLTTPWMYGVDTNGDESALQTLLGVNVATYVKQEPPQVGPCPPGFSCFDDQNYGWYTFTIDATAQYGAQEKSSSTLFELGRAEGRGRMTVGPISAFGR